LISIIISMCNAQTQTYGTLGLDTAWDEFNAATAQIDKFNETTMPREAMPVRMAILRARTELDIFVFAMPLVSTTIKNDTWSRIRNDLADGFCTVGSFLSLHTMNVNMTNKEMKKRRNAVLKWKASFVNNSNHHGYAGYLKTISQNTFFYRPDTVLSPMFWGGIKGRPDAKYTGYQNIAQLAQGILKQVIDLYDNLVNVNNIYDHEKSFTTYRKLSRSLRTTLHLFPSILSQKSLEARAFTCTSANIVTSFNNVTQSLEEIGAILKAVDYYKDNKQNKKRAKAIDLANSTWLKFKKQMRLIPLEEVYACFVKNLIFGPPSEARA